MAIKMTEVGVDTFSLILSNVQKRFYTHFEKNLWALWLLSNCLIVQISFVTIKVTATENNILNNLVFVSQLFYKPYVLAYKLTRV